MNILVADDEETIRTVIRELLNAQGYDCILACNGEEAIRTLQERTSLPDTCIDAVITDIMMPKMDGLQLTRMIHSINRNLPILVMTGHGDTFTAEEAMNAGACDFLLKPFQANELYLRLERSIRLMQLKSHHADQMHELRKLGSEMIHAAQRDAQEKIAALEAEIKKHTHSGRCAG